MRLRVLAVLVTAVLATSCARGEPAPSPTPDLGRADLRKALLGAEDIGEGWKAREDASPNTVQIGGRVGAANVRPVRASATAAFEQEEGSGYVSNTLLLVRSEAVARAVIASHEEAASRDSWTQDRDDGGKAAFSFFGGVGGVTAVGDELFAARLKVEITRPDAEPTDHTVEYVVFSVGPIVAFVVTQDTGASGLARRVESEVATLLTDTP